jgi:hypothetical protein
MLNQEPTLTFRGVAGKLEGVAPIEVERMIREECERQGDVQKFYQFSLYSVLRTHLPGGWRQASSWANTRAGAFWLSTVGPAEKKFANAVWNRLGMLVQDGWSPESSEDPIVKHALTAGGE